ILTLQSPVSYLLSPISRLLSPVSRLLSPVSYLLSPFFNFILQFHFSLHFHSSISIFDIKQHTNVILLIFDNSLAFRIALRPGLRWSSSAIALACQRGAGLQLKLATALYSSRTTRLLRRAIGMPTDLFRRTGGHRCRPNVRLGSLELRV